MVKLHPTLSFTSNPEGRTILTMMMRGMDDFSKWDFTPIPKRKTIYMMMKMMMMMMMRGMDDFFPNGILHQFQKEKSYR